MSLTEIKPYLNQNVNVTIGTDQFKGFLSNYTCELDDNDDLVETVDLDPGDAEGYGFVFDLEQISKIELID